MLNEHKVLVVFLFLCRGSGFWKRVVSHCVLLCTTEMDPIPHPSPLAWLCMELFFSPLPTLWLLSCRLFTIPHAQHWRWIRSEMKRGPIDPCHAMPCGVMPCYAVSCHGADGLAPNDPRQRPSPSQWKNRPGKKKKERERGGIESREKENIFVIVPCPVVGKGDPGTAQHGMVGVGLDNGKQGGIPSWEREWAVLVPNVPLEKKKESVVERVGYRTSARGIGTQRTNCLKRLSNPVDMHQE